MKPDCVFCQIVSGDAPATIYGRSPWVIVFAPLNPVTEAHALVVPTTHLKDATTNPAWTGETMRVAAEYVAELDTPANIITSIGAEATQTIFHLHLHVVPRREGDGLKLPWTNQQEVRT